VIGCKNDDPLSRDDRVAQLPFLHALGME
jgi:hypothetical protein